MAYEEMMVGGGIMAMIAAFAAIFIFIGIAMYIYMALVWSTIAKKLGYDKPWLAWIPIVSAVLLPILAKKHWAWVFILLIPFVNIVFILIWMWKIYEQRHYPGWLALIPLVTIIPIIGMVAGIAQIVVMGLVAWVDR